MADRQIVMVGFLQAQNCSNYPASWRHSESAGDFMSPAYYARIARALEDGKFHLAFDDRLAMPDIYGADHAESVRNGVRVVKRIRCRSWRRWRWGPSVLAPGDLLDHC